jgi:glycosyltransferase involved in cell wall biosynthesis
VRAIIITHVSRAEAAIAPAPGQACDLLVYGQGHEGFPTPVGWRRISLPPVGIKSLPAAARWWWALRRQGYDEGVLAHPGLERSRLRGPLLAVGHILGAKAVRTDDGVPIPRLRAVTDLTAWALAQLASATAAYLAALLVERWAARLERREIAVPTVGPAMYLRTDIELADEPLRAGGSASHTAGIIDALQKRGHPVAFWSTGAIDGVAPPSTLPIVRYPNVSTELLELLSGIRQAWRLRVAADPTAVVYQRYSMNNLAGLIHARRANAAFVLEVNNSEVTWRRQWSTLRFARLAMAVERLLFTHADRVGTVSANAAADLVAAGAPASKIQVIPNGVDVDRFSLAEPNPLPFPEGSFVVAFSGLFYPWHGVPTLAEAFVILAARVPHARLLLVGDGGDGPRVRATLEAAGLLNLVHWPGVIPRHAVPGYLRAANVVASPHAGADGFIGSPIKLFEYLAAGTAIVASDVAQIGEILRDEETALLVPPDDPIALAAALERLAEDPALRARLGAAARRDATQHHSWDARLDALLAPDG